jgi:hypothetical protein
MLMRSSGFYFLFLLTVLFSCTDDKPEPTPNFDKLDDSSTRVRTERDLNPYATVDISPMDMSYYPVEYPKLKMSKVTAEPPVARVVYSRPHLGGRSLFTDILHYDSTWRLGANEATEIEFYRDVTIQAKPVKSGRYILYCTPGKESWTIILNSNIDTWGLQQDPAGDIARFAIPVTTTQRRIEYFTMIFEKSATGAHLVMAWDDLEARLPIEF